MFKIVFFFNVSFKYVYSKDVYTWNKCDLQNVLKIFFKPFFFVLNKQKWKIYEINSKHLKWKFKWYFDKNVLKHVFKVLYKLCSLVSRMPFP